MKNTILLQTILLIFALSPHLQALSATKGPGTRKGTVEEKIWALEKSYFENLYKANYDGVLALYDNQFLGWPGGLPQPIGREESAGFMKQLIPKPTSCTVRIERAGIRVQGTTAITQYTLYVNCKDTSVMKQPRPSRITHTWVKEGAGWKLLSGMSIDK